MDGRGSRPGCPGRAGGGTGPRVVRADVDGAVGCGGHRVRAGGAGEVLGGDGPAGGRVDRGQPGGLPGHRGPEHRLSGRAGGDGATDEQHVAQRDAEGVDGHPGGGVGGGDVCGRGVRGPGDGQGRRGGEGDGGAEQRAAVRHERLLLFQRPPGSRRPSRDGQYRNLDEAPRAVPRGVGELLLVRPFATHIGRGRNDPRPTLHRRQRPEPPAGSYGSRWVWPSNSSINSPLTMSRRPTVVLDSAQFRSWPKGSAHGRSSPSPAGRRTHRRSGTPPVGPCPRPGRRRTRRHAHRSPLAGISLRRGACA